MVVEIRDERAFRYAPTHGRDELAARLMVDALDQVADRDCRHAALVHFVAQVGLDETAALRRALAEVDGMRRGRGQALPGRQPGSVARRSLSSAYDDRYSALNAEEIA